MHAGLDHDVQLMHASPPPWQHAGPDMDLPPCICCAVTNQGCCWLVVPLLLLLIYVLSLCWLPCLLLLLQVT
jgi:hypothetical protein